MSETAQNLNDRAGKVRPGEELDAARVADFLRRQGVELPGEPEIAQFAGGASNLTYLLRFADRDLILRRPPFGQRAGTAHDMVREGTPVARGDLKRGDLVLFGHRGTFTHIGIYAGNNQFVHATHSGSPVMVTNLDADYYRTRYMTAVRLLPQ